MLLAEHSHDLNSFSIGERRRLIWQLFWEHSGVRWNCCSNPNAFHIHPEMCRQLNGWLIVLDTGQKCLMDIWSLKTNRAWYSDSSTRRAAFEWTFTSSQGSSDRIKINARVTTKNSIEIIKWRSRRWMHYKICFRNFFIFTKICLSNKSMLGTKINWKLCQLWIQAKFYCLKQKKKSYSNPNMMQNSIPDHLTAKRPCAKPLEDELNRCKFN